MKTRRSRQSLRDPLSREGGPDPCRLGEEKNRPHADAHMTSQERWMTNENRAVVENVAFLDIVGAINTGQILRRSGADNLIRRVIRHVLCPAILPMGLRCIRQLRSIIIIRLKALNIQHQFPLAFGVRNKSRLYDASATRNPTIHPSSI